MQSIPHPLASVIAYGSHRYLVDNITNRGEPAYSLLGAEYLGTKGDGIAWIDHAEVTLLQSPSVRSWNALWKARTPEPGKD